MKVYNKVLICAMTALSVAGLSSCKEDFVDEDASHRPSTGLLDTPEGAQALAASLYANIRWHFGYEWAYGITLYGCDEFLSAADLTSEPWNKYDNRLGPLDCTPALGAANNNCPAVSALWDEMYYGISTANLVLDKASDEIALGEAHFLRGYNYYRLFAQYGAVTLQLKPTADLLANYKRATEEETLNQVIADFEAAYDLLPAILSRDGHLGYGTWTKYTAAHFLAKALLFRQSERCASWNSKYPKENDLNRVIALCDEVITACPLVDDYNDLYANWTGIDCEIEGTTEILMAAMHGESYPGRFGNRTYNYFNPQFSNFSGGYTQRGQYIGGMDFQRCRPTEYAYAVFDNVNDSRMWKTFKTIYGYNNYQTPETMHSQGCPEGAEPELGQEGIMFILNKKDYDPGCGTYGRAAEPHTFVNPETGKWVPNVVSIYDGGNYNMDQHGASGNPATCNFFCGINKTDDGSRTAEKGDAHRDVTMARTGETVLVKAEAQVRLGKYQDAIATVNVLRKRAEWKKDEDREYYVDGTIAFQKNSTSSAILGKCKNQNGVTISNSEAYKYSFIQRNTYFLSTGVSRSVNKTPSSLQIASYTALPAEDEAILAKLGCSGDYDRMLNFIMNERTRELLGEWNRWEELSRCGLLIRRAKAFNNLAADKITEGKHELRPIPQTFIDALQDDNGNNLGEAEKKKWQNPGYDSTETGE
ncbi:MAG: RagB/SusD family nutrient uptake outer membrane protein [Bacteroidales bacterium]|nr:RagB/SusD family nutrient uptake outer membrane protein [Bacteroidales bacterium]